MCRMLAAVTPSRMRREWLEAFSTLARTGRTPRNDGSGHPDGWGVVYYRDGFPAYLGRQPVNILERDSAFPEALEKVTALRTPLLIAHMRKSSRGTRQMANTHPFMHGRWAFAHNGTAQMVEEMPLRKYSVDGGTDSERLFKFLLERIEEKAPHERPDAIRAALAGIRHFNSLTFLLSDGRVLYAFRGVKFASNTARTRERLAYYTLKYAVAGDSLLICSEGASFRGIMDEPWSELDNWQLLVVDVSDPLNSIRVLEQAPLA